MAGLLFTLFVFSCSAYVEWTTVLLVWSNPKQSNRTSAVLWYFPLWLYPLAAFLKQILLVVSSVTRWVDYLLNVLPFTANKILPNRMKNCQSRFKGLNPQERTKDLWFCHIWSHRSWVRFHWTYILGHSQMNLMKGADVLSKIVSRTVLTLNNNFPLSVPSF